MLRTRHSTLTLTLLIVLNCLTGLAQDFDSYDNTPLPVLLHHSTYMDTEKHPQPVHELIMIAKSKWHFDGLVLSMDGLIDEFGHTERHITRGIKQLNKDLDALGLTKSFKDNKFQLRLDVDFHSKLTRDLPKELKLFAINHILTNLNVVSHNYSDGPTKSETICNVPFKRGLPVIMINQSSVLFAGRFADVKQPAAFYEVYASGSLQWSLNDDGSVFCGSKEFENFYKLLLKK